MWLCREVGWASLAELLVVKCGAQSGSQSWPTGPRKYLGATAGLPFPAFLKPSMRRDWGIRPCIFFQFDLQRHCLMTVFVFNFNNNGLIPPLKVFKFPFRLYKCKGFSANYNPTHLPVREFFFICFSSLLTFLSQVIQATIEKHKQNSETFRAFNSSFSQEEEHLPDSSVSTSASFSFSRTVLPTVKTCIANFKIMVSCSGFLYDIIGQSFPFLWLSNVYHSYSPVQIQNKLLRAIQCQRAISHVFQAGGFFWQNRCNSSVLWVLSYLECCLYPWEILFITFPHLISDALWDYYFVILLLFKIF